MKKLIAVILSLLVICTAFACLVSAADEGTTKDPYETDIPQVITNVFGDYAADHRQELGNGLKFFRIIFENLSNFAKDLAEAFDNFIDRVKSFSTDGWMNRLPDLFKR